MNQRMQLYLVISILSISFVREALAMKKRMQHGSLHDNMKINGTLRGTCTESENATPKAKIQHQIHLLFQRHFHQILPITLNPVSLQTKHLTVPASEHLAFRSAIRVSGSLCFLQYMIMPLIESPSYFIIVSSKS